VSGAAGALQKLVSPARAVPSRVAAEEELQVPRGLPRSPLQVTVTPLRSKTAVIPWIGVGTPVALVTVRDPDFDRQQRQLSLRRRFELTPAEAALASEIQLIVEEQFSALLGISKWCTARRCVGENGTRERRSRVDARRPQNISLRWASRSLREFRSAAKAHRFMRANPRARRPWRRLKAVLAAT